MMTSGIALLFHSGCVGLPFFPAPFSKLDFRGALRGLISPGKAGKKQMGPISADWVATTLPFSSFRGGRGKGRRKERDPCWYLNPVQVCARPPWFLEAALWDSATSLWGPC